ncbi:hypothetical protein AB6N23_15500, partial [Cellulomonas sp. 179-A 9B4 NHS]
AGGRTASSAPRPVPAPAPAGPVWGGSAAEPAAAPAPQAVGSSPFAPAADGRGTTGPAPDAAVPVRGEPSAPWGRAVADEHDDEDLDDEPETRRYPYTWLHLLVLALVAFVLGFLIMLLLINARGDETAAGVPALTLLAAVGGAPPL